MQKLKTEWSGEKKLHPVEKEKRKVENQATIDIYTMPHGTDA